MAITGFASTLRFCSNDKDSVYVKALASSVTFLQQIDGQITLRNGSGITTVILTPYVAVVKPAPKQVTFNNTYKPSLTDDSDLLVKFESNNRVSLINGCNSQSATY